MVENSPSCAHENVNSLSKLSDLIINIDSAIYRDNFELVVIMLQFCELVGDLKRQLSRWCQNNRRELSRSKNLVPSQIFDSWKTESKGLA